MPPPAPGLWGVPSPRRRAGRNNLESPWTSMPPRWNSKTKILRVPLHPPPAANTSPPHPCTNSKHSSSEGQKQVISTLPRQPGPCNHAGRQRSSQDGEGECVCGGFGSTFFQYRTSRYVASGWSQAAVDRDLCLQRCVLLIAQQARLDTGTNSGANTTRTDLGLGPLSCATAVQVDH